MNATETMTESMESRPSSSGIFSHVSPRCSSAVKSQGETPETFTGRILFMSMFSDISCDKKDNEEEECVANAKVVSIFAKKFCIGQRSFIGPGSERSGILWKRIVHKEFGVISRKRYCWNSQKADVQFSVQQLHFPGVSSKAKDTENCLYILLRIITQLRLFFA